MYNRERLIGLIRETNSLKTGEFTLASGKKASYYLDCRRVTLHPQGANQVAEGILELLGNDLPRTIGGMAIGADPITASVVTLAGQRGHDLRGFIVRKEAKGHGTGRDVEGPVEPGDTAIIVEDVVSTGGSSLKAIAKAREFGLQVQGVIAIVDRLMGAAAAFDEAGCPLRSLLTIRDFGIEPPVD